MKSVRVVAALIADGERFLVQQRLPNKSRPNLWEFPGGKVEPGETDEQALARECEEELAVSLHVGRRLWSTTHAYADLTIELVLYAARIERGDPKCLGAQALRWASVQELKSLPWCEADVPLVDGLLNGSIVTS